ncbi:rod shape-determining protein RodA [Allonocardiopsis opalescens]|uniref:Rod shape determining protein RodA n=1 Tax=Allonocardiopsis opalescens TaxID=1144618 RepID=A0A2T0PXV6_9ACTN|nr:rod shape-determining protein RodA [Allonocardiopsis opalescens]PRX96365.1 rod shape determining protein RodA [Allonocardiopsis opalescens]
MRPRLPAQAGRLDWVLIGAVGGLTLIGTLLVWSATHAEQLQLGASPQEYLWRHLVNVAIGAVLCAAVAMIDYRVLKAYALYAYALAIVALLLIFTPLGATINGSHSWVVFGPGLQLQPSELAKVALVLMLAWLLGEPHRDAGAPMTRDVLVSLAVLALPTVLIMLQPDLGTTLVIGAMFLGVLMLSGAPLAWVGGLVGAGIAGAFTVWQVGILEDYQVARFAAFADPSLDPRGAGYNVNQSMIAVGSGGVGGKGLFNGEQTSGQFVPEQHTDFIFTVAGEELGLFGAAAVIVLLGLVIWRMLTIGAQCADPYGRLIAAGVACWMTVQGVVCIGMTMGMMPVTGVPLPFVSYGGTATLAGLLALGLVLGVQSRVRTFE